MYVGEWVFGKKHGYGTCTYRSGDVYEGTWVNDEVCSICMLCMYVCDVYEGTWVNDEYVVYVCCVYMYVCDVCGHLGQ
jgi:hypothetical protein